jgi:hypothetical protein
MPDVFLRKIASMIASMISALIAAPIASGVSFSAAAAHIVTPNGQAAQRLRSFVTVPRLSFSGFLQATGVVMSFLRDGR